MKSPQGFGWTLTHTHGGTQTHLIAAHMKFKRGIVSNVLYSVIYNASQQLLEFNFTMNFQAANDVYAVLFLVHYRFRSSPLNCRYPLYKLINS